MSAPSVYRIPPPHDLPKDHHGPLPKVSPVDGHIALPDGEELIKPKYFQNPWKSWRGISIWDAYTAYRKGAAIALPLSRTARSKKKAKSFGRSFGKKGGNTIPGTAPTEPDESDSAEDGDESSDDEIVEPEDNPRDPDGAIRETRLYPVPSRTYVRPELSVIHADDEESDWSDPPLEVVSPKWHGRVNDTDVTWLGHASVLVRIPWKKSGREEAACGVLFDPIFSYRCSPSQYVGPARYLNPPCSIADLPPIHVVCISHDHYDHLDYNSIIDLWKNHSATIHFFVPFGLTKWFVSSGIPEDRVTELDWWHETILSFPSDSSSFNTQGVDNEAALNLKLVFTPGQHRSGRGLMGHMSTLWGSWCIGVVEPENADKAEQRGMRDWTGFKMYFGGDTGYKYAPAAEQGDPDAICPAFQQIADLYGPISFALLPLSTGSSLPFLRTVLSISLDQYTLTSSQHCSPGDALDIHKILGSKRTLGIHWGTFCDSHEARGTRIEFGRERRKRGVSGVWAGDEDNEEGAFITANIGETLVLP